MRRNRLAVAVSAFAVGSALLLAGCSAGGETSDDTLRVAIWGVNSDIDSIKEAAKGFEEANPDVKIKFEVGDCGPDYAACKKLIAGKNMPDVLVAGSWNYFAMVRDGVLADLTPTLDEAGVTTADFTPTVIEALETSDGDLYGLPMGYNTQSLFYNTDMFAAAGLAEPPADGSYTYDDLRDWSKKLTLDANGNNAESAEFDPENITQWGYYNRVALSSEPGYGPVLSAFGGGVLTGEERNECSIDSPESIEAFQYLQDLMWTDHSTITPQLEQEEPGYLRWVKGQVAMQQGSHEQVNIVAEQNPELNYNMAALPAGPAGNATLLQIHIWGVYAGSDKQDVASQFATYMATEGSGKQMGLIPAYQDRALGEDFALAPGEPSNVVAAQIDPASWPLTTVNVDPSNLWASVSGQDGFAPAMEDLISDRKSAEEAFGGICESKIDPIIEASQQ
ncbi:ABC transporter substrate-binding protein [Agromyces subbeticus]|uniref:ABC transporter substrate-binding protein n=1 Tax=Agromyces subbeticus TaxID=293890 RepID=UPI0003B614B8|nr:sugar ABC transporter substrate-binding protein [Agromyces subbeticus]